MWCLYMLAPPLARGERCSPLPPLLLASSLTYFLVCLSSLGASFFRSAPAAAFLASFSRSLSGGRHFDVTVAPSLLLSQTVSLHRPISLLLVPLHVLCRWEARQQQRSVAR